MSRRFILLSLAVANAALAVAVWTRQPWANGPAEWRWEYLPVAGSNLPGGAAGPAALASGTALGGTPMLGVAGAAVVLALAGLALLCGHRRLAAWRGALPLALACGAAFTFGLVAAQPGGFARVTASLVSRNSFGYVWDAALAPSSRTLLADYPAASAGLNQHSVTHPPGPLLAVRALGFLDRALPPAGVAGQTGLPAQAATAVAREMGRAHAHGRPVPRSPPGAWPVAALAVLLPALSVLAAWPLYGLALAWGCGRPGALLAAVLWLLVPARSLFTPSFDQALPAALAGAAWLAAQGGRWRAAAAGGLLFAACFLSYGCLPVLPAVAACALAGGGLAMPRRPAQPPAQAAPADPRSAAAAAATGELASPDAGAEVRAGAAGQTHAGTLRQRWPWPQTLAAPALPKLAALGLGFALPYLALAIFAGHDPWHAMRAALALHHQIAVAPRSYLTWLVWNPYDFALLLSPAVLGLAAAALRLPGRRRLAVWCWWGLLGLLLLSGSVRGEVGRIWLVWMPFACLFAAAWLGEPAAAVVSGIRPPADTGGEVGGGAAEATWIPGRRELALLLGSQAALTLTLAARMVFVS